MKQHHLLLCVLITCALSFAFRFYLRKGSDESKLLYVRARVAINGTKEIISPAETICMKETPECVSKATLIRNWGNLSAIKGYQQANCCKKHLVVKRGVVFAMEHFSKKMELPLILSGGSAIGQYRHDGMQVPWTNDGDMYAFLDVSSRLTVNNFRNKFLSINKDPTLNETWYMVDSGPHFALQYRNKKETFKPVDIFIYSKQTKNGKTGMLPIHPGWAEQLYYPIPMDVLFPAVDCHFYSNILRKGCARNIQAFLIHYYGKQVLIGPSKQDTSGYDSMKITRFTEEKKAEIILFFEFCFVYFLFVSCVYYNKFGKRIIGINTTNLFNKCLLLFVLCIPFFVAALRVWYESKYGQYTLGVNYGTTLLSMILQKQMIS
jgi:hypothetical protein